MPRLTIQFIPNGEHAGAGVSVVENSRVIESIQDTTAGRTVIYLQSEDQITINDLGYIRYSTAVDSLSDEELWSTYQSAIDALQSILEGEQRHEYRVCVILHGDNPVKLYIEAEKEIDQFAEEHFNVNNPDYAELDENTIKLSLSTGNVPVRV